MAPSARASPSTTKTGKAAAPPARKKQNDALCRALIAYGEYHAHPLNQLIHLVCVPAILWSLLVALFYAPLPLPPALRPAADALCAGLAAARPLPFLSSLPADLCAGLARPLPLAVVLLYGAYYTLALDPFAGAAWTAAVGAPLWLGAARLWRLAGPAAAATAATAAATTAGSSAWRWALGVHVLSWYAQIHPGHAVLERRRPALVDSFWQAIATAPLFVFLELLFALGWNKGLRARVGAGVEEALRRHRAAVGGKKG